jgi:CDP-diacylglycerol--glycerol-3-phosphate 3-phosphatidyltransferase
MALRSLRAQWALFSFLGAAALAASAWLLIAAWEYALSWCLFATAAFALQMAFLWLDLPFNRKSERSTLLAAFGMGSWVSLLRLLLLSALVAFLAFPWPTGAVAWLPFVIYLVFNLGDLLDGYLARITGTSSQLGERLDLALDGRGVLVASLLAWHYGEAGWWYLLVGFARYIFVFGLWLRQRLGLPFISFENPLRRPLAGVQMGVGTAILAPGLPLELTLLASTLTMLPFLANFSYDWFVGIGWLPQPHNAPRKTPRRNTALDWLSLAIRVAIGPLLLAISSPFILLLGAAVVLGLGGRLAAFGLLIAVAISTLGDPALFPELAIITLGLALLYLGSGRFTLLATNEGWLLRRQGGSKARRA